MKTMPAIYTTEGAVIKPSRLFMSVQLAIRDIETGAMSEEDIAREAKRRVLSLVRMARLQASVAGRDHPIWQAIFDAEEWLAGRPTIDPIEVIIDKIRKGGLA